jgi:hypothetical protein
MHSAPTQRWVQDKFSRNLAARATADLRRIGGRMGMTASFQVEATNRGGGVELLVELVNFSNK